MFSGKNRLYLLAAAAAFIGAAAGANHTRAETLFWKPNGISLGGDGSWDITSPLWSNGATQQTYANSLTTEAIFSRTDSSAGNIAAFLNDTLNINSLKVTNDVALPTKRRLQQGR